MVGKSAETAARNMIFLSHATPEDNDLARWLALQLAGEGYPVWCDLTKLLGGEDFWRDIQDAIRNRSLRFLFVLSRFSNAKDGTLQELACAKATASRLKPGIRDFIIALKSDDLPYSEVDIEIQRLNHIPFSGSWATGLAQLLKKFEEDGVPRDTRFNRDTVNSWFRSQAEFAADHGIYPKSELQWSNWCAIESFPERIWCHNISRRTTGRLDIDVSHLKYPAAKATDLSFLCFAKAAEVENELGPSIYIQSSSTIQVSEILKENHTLGRQLVSILRQAWENTLLSHLFSVQDVSPRPSRFFLTKGKIPDDRLFFEGVAGKRSYRDIVGYATKRGIRRYWHYAISAKPELKPRPHLVVRGHVLFSDTGHSLWSDAEKMAKARRNQCKGWWNDEWRDRMLAVLTHLRGEEPSIALQLSPSDYVLVNSNPELFECPVSYVGEWEAGDEPDDYFDEDEEDGEEEGLSLDGDSEDEYEQTS